ncbi:MAG: hypothetical protein AAB975_02530 [Patescibacteria group bacterium]
MDTNFTSVHQIIKINGVSPSALTKLHEILDGPQVKSPYYRNHISSFSDIVYAELLNVKWNKEYATYTVEIQLCMKYSPGTGIINKISGHSLAEIMNPVLYAPFSVLRAIYGALGFYPETEQVVSSVSRKP